MIRPRAKARRLDADAAARWLTRRASDAHKGSNGRVYVLAGSRGMAGAAVLASLGAVRSGAGLVRIGTVRSQQPVVARRAPLEVTSDALPEDSGGRLSSWAAIQRAIERFQPDVIAAGPGLGRSPTLTNIIRRLVYASPVALVLDADGLNALASLGRPRQARAPLILTPHVGEMARLLKIPARRVSADRAGAAIDAAKRFGAVALLKGAGTLVTDGRALFRNATGNSGMATGGTGDVLTGVIAATWGQMAGQTVATGLKAAALGAYLHGLAGDIAADKFPERSMIASDLAQGLPAAFARLWRRKLKGGKE